jgi:phosphate transport system substrate-binding protein
MTSMPVGNIGSVTFSVGEEPTGSRGHNQRGEPARSGHEERTHKMIGIRGRRTRLVLAVAALALVAAACGGSAAEESDSGGETLSGEIVASGSSTVEPITASVGEKFIAENPDVKLSVEGPGTSDGFELFCNGDIDISDASRPIEQEEIAACKKEGIDFIEVKVGIDGLSVITSPENTEIECLDFYDLYALTSVEAEGFEQWSDANELGEEIGAAHVPYPDVPLEMTAPGEESGTFDSFAEIVLEDIAYEERDIEEDAPVVRPDYQASSDDNVIIEGVSGSATSLGWVGYAFAQGAGESVRSIPIAEKGDECVEPTDETIRSGEYPIARDLFFYVKAESAEENDAVAAFVDFYLSEAGIASVSEVGYVDLDPADLEESRKAWEDRETGTREA